LKPREFSLRSKGRIGEPELSRYLGGKATPSLKKAVAIDELTSGRVPAKSWVHTTSGRRTATKAA
jgi:hypothetical protein